MTFDPILPLSMIMLMLFPFTIFLLWQEWGKKNKFPSLRIVSATLLMLALAGIMLRPKFPSKKLSKMILLTPGYSKKEVDSIMHQHPMWSLAHLPDVKPFKNSELLPENDLPNRSKEIQIVAGQGIPIYHLDRMQGKAYRFVPGTPPEGITTLSIPARNFVNRKNTITGTYNSLHEHVWLYLTGPTDREDSIEIRVKGESHFELSFVPKLAGQFIYTLTAKDPISTTHEKLPVHVEKEHSLNVVFLLSYPTFEVQYLKNFLARKNCSIVLRYQVSRNNFRYEYVNRDRISFSRLANTLLATTDLLVIDATALSALSLAERNDLRQAINSGLGLLNLSVVNDRNLRTFFPFKTTPAKNDTAQVKMTTRSFNLPAARVRVANGPGLTPILMHRDGILAGFTFHGAGKIGFQLVQETFRLGLAGDSLPYSEIWTPLLERVARRQATNSEIKIVTPFPWYEEEPIDISVISSNENISLLDDSVEIPIREDMTLDNIWYARTWGGKSGWHRLLTSDATELHYYTFVSPAWKSLYVANQMRVNAFIGTSTATGVQREFESREDIPPIIFYLVFLCAAGFIWLAPKL